MSHGKDTVWVPYADLMTTLMLVFLLISVTYAQITKIQAENQKKEIKQYVAGRDSIYHELKTQFSQYEKDKWIEIDKDLSIKFRHPDINFESGSSKLREQYAILLDKVFPEYIKTLFKYKRYITEVRIEGHTDNIDTYMYNLKLSQDRAREVLEYFREQPYFTSLPEGERKQLEYWFSANGMSYSRLLDYKGEPIQKSNNLCNLEKSRRVEFKIITSGDAVIHKQIQNNK